VVVIKFFFRSLPSIEEADKRWTIFQIVLSAAFALVAIAVGVLTINTSNVDVTLLVIALVCFGLALLAVVYAFGLGIHWYSKRRVINNDVESERAKRDDRLHEDMQALIADMHENNRILREIQAGIKKA
jgi:type VI protein secretion system component VasK